MILVSFFEIFDGFWSTKKLPSLLLHVIQDLLVLFKSEQILGTSKQLLGLVQSISLVSEKDLCADNQNRDPICSRKEVPAK